MLKTKEQTATGAMSIRDKRDSLGMTLNDLHKLSRIQPALLSRMERNIQIPTDNEKKRLARAFACSTDDLVFPKVVMATGL